MLHIVPNKNVTLKKEESPSVVLLELGTARVVKGELSHSLQLAELEMGTNC